MRQLLASETGFFRRVVEQAAELAFMLLDPDGTIAFWNAGAEKIFGYTPGEAIGRHFSMLFTIADREARVFHEELRRARETGRADDTRWHLRQDGRRVFLDGVTMPIIGQDGRFVGYSKFARDITERHQTEQRLAAQLALTSLLSTDAPTDVVARSIMQTVCEHLGWDIGAMWQPEGDAMRCVDHWSAPGIDAALVHQLCSGLHLKRGVGLVGEVWQHGEAVWITDFLDTERFPRAPVAERLGMRIAFAFPITSEGHVVGVMEFFSGAVRETEQALLPIMTLIGAQTGEFMERRRTQQALRESEERYRLVTESAQDAIFSIDERSTITFCNRAVTRMLGYEPEELIGQPLNVIMPERYRQRHSHGVERYLTTRQRHVDWTGMELPALHKNGTEVPCEISFAEWTRDGQTIFTGFARDITERTRARDELHRAFEHEQQAREEAEGARAQLQRRADEEAAFRHLASALTGAVETTDVLYEITNRATQVTRADGVYVERVVPTPNGNVVEVVSTSGRGTPPRGLRVSYPGSLTDEMVRDGSPVILADMASFGQSMAPYLKDTCDDCEILVTPLVAEDEPLGALVLLNSRSSGRHFRENDVVRARTLGDLTSLALRRVRLMEEEREAKEKAEAAVRVRDETLGIVSHDLRNPLTKIALSVDLLDEATAEERADLTDTIRSSARQMQRLIQDLLDVARVEAGGLAIDQRELDTNALLREVCETQTMVAQQKRQTIVCHARQMPPICADHDRLMQVFGNLVGNAIKFTPERGTITIDARVVGSAVEFTVRDTGPGIPEADLKNVFTPYWQAKKTAHMGAGLGLAIVRGIVEAHGGRVLAENAPGGGAQFRFTVPTAHPAAERQSGTAAQGNDAKTK